jgi:hypothetical protein
MASSRQHGGTAQCPPCKARVVCWTDLAAAAWHDSTLMGCSAFVHTLGLQRHVRDLHDTHSWWGLMSV